MRALLVDEIYHKPYKSYDIPKAFQYSLKQLGVECDITGIKGVEKLPHYDLAIYFLFELPKRCKLRKGKINIFYHSEQLPRSDGRTTPASDLRWKELQEKIPHFDHILDFSFANACFLKSKGYSAAYCPWAYSPVFDVGVTGIKEIHDVSVLATLTGHRKAGVDLLRESGIEIQTFCNIYGIEPVVRALKECKISLNLHNDSLSTFESGRVVCLSMSNGLFVVSEPYDDEPVPFKDKEHLIITPRANMADVIKHYLREPEQRKTMAERAYGFVKENYVFTESIYKALKEIKVL